jgi:hypothetical protein
MQSVAVCGAMNVWHETLLPIQVASRSFRTDHGFSVKVPVVTMSGVAQEGYFFAFPGSYFSFHILFKN